MNLVRPKTGSKVFVLSIQDAKYTIETGIPAVTPDFIHGALAPSGSKPKIGDPLDAIGKSM